MQADVLPVPMAPTMAMPVYRPRSGIDQPPRLAGALRRGPAVLLAEDEEELLALLRRGIRRQRLPSASCGRPRATKMYSDARHDADQRRTAC